MKGAEQSTFIHGGVCGNRYTCLKIKKTVSDDYLKESCEAGFFLIYKELRMRKYFFNMVRTKVILLFVIVLSVLTSVFFYLMHRSKQIVYEKVTEVNQTLLDSYGKIIEEKFSSAEAFLVSQRLQPSLYLGIEREEQSKENYFAAYDIYDFFQNSAFGEKSFDYIFAYAPKSETYVDYGYSFTDEKENIFESAIREKIKNGNLDTEKWKIAEIQEKASVYYMISVYDVYIGCVIELDGLRSQFMQEQKNEEGLLFFDSAGQLLSIADENDNSFFQDTKLSDYESVNLDSKKYLKNTIQICGGALMLMRYADQKYLAEQLEKNNQIVYIFTPILAVLMISGIWILWRSLITPLSNLLQGVNELKKGNFQYQLSECKNGEFRELTAAFQDMGREIWKLKIDIYEEQIQRQKAQLAFLQNQLKPHFLLNCLNNLRALELAGEHDKFQNLITKEGSYMRATLSSRGICTLEEELQNINNYVEIQKVRYENRFDIEISVCRDLLQMNVPTQILQCFVENAIKYQLDVGKKLQIKIKIDFADPDCEFMKIIVVDNGSGFSQEVLELLNAGKQIKKEDRTCVGIYNVMNRLKIYYEDRAKIYFRNQENQGASIEILIPVE